MRPKTKVHPLARVLFLLENLVFIQIWANYLGVVKSNEVLWEMCVPTVYFIFSNSYFICLIGIEFNKK